MNILVQCRMGKPFFISIQYVHPGYQPLDVGVFILLPAKPVTGKVPWLRTLYPLTNLGCDECFMSLQVVYSSSGFCTDFSECLDVVWRLVVLKETQSNTTRSFDSPQSYLRTHLACHDGPNRFQGLALIQLLKIPYHRNYKNIYTCIYIVKIYRLITMCDYNALLL